jgi:hypothetical protein
MVRELVLMRTTGRIEDHSRVLSGSWLEVNSQSAQVQTIIVKDFEAVFDLAQS